MIKKAFFATLILLGLEPWILMSCAHSGSAKTGSEASAPSGSDAEMDAALGALPEKGKTEAQREIEDLEIEDETEQALREMRKREREEEQRRLQYAITEERILDQQTQ